MKRLFVVMTLLLALVGVPAVIHAQDTNPARLAQYFPVETQFYAAIRTDDAFLDTLDTLIGSVRDKLPAALNVPKMGLRDALDMSLAQSSLKFEDIRAWLGDYAALGINDLTETARTGRTTTGTTGFFVVEITDKAAAESFFKSLPNFSENMVESEENGYTVYRRAEAAPNDGYLALSDSVLILGINTADLPAGGLDGSVKFTGTLDKLPADSYNALVYVEVAPAFAASMERNPQGAEELQAAGIDLTALNPLAVGFTLLGDQSLTVDLVEPGIPGLLPELSPVDPAFAANIPDNFSFVVQGSNLSGLANAALDAVEKASQKSDNPVTRTQITGLIQAFLSLDLDEDVLSWTTGDFAVVADLDMRLVLEDLQSGSKSPNFDPRTGFILDASADPAKAQKVAQTLGELIVRQLQQSKNTDVKASMGEVGGVNALIIEGALANSPEFSQVEIVLGANEKVFLLADRATAEAIFSGDFAPLSNSAAFQEAAQNMLPGAAGLMFADGAGWGDLVALGGTLFIAQAPGSSTDDLAQVIEALKFGYDVFSSSSVSAVPLEGGDILVRAVLTLK